MSQSIFAEAQWTLPNLARLQTFYQDSSPSQLLHDLLVIDESKLSFACSFGLEDLVILDILSRLPKQPEIFVLDTGRLHPETYDLMERWRTERHLQFRILYPHAETLEKFVSLYGINSFYESIMHRKACCEIRKIEPLHRALEGKIAWITGLRREQSSNRSHIQLFEADDTGRLKVSPLVNWSLNDVWQYILHHKLPYNPLHDRGYPSIGCAPCTRAIQKGEDIRAGRWWWEQSSQKECGLHKIKRKEFDHASQSTE